MSVTTDERVRPTRGKRSRLHRLPSITFPGPTSSNCHNFVRRPGRCLYYFLRVCLRDWDIDDWVLVRRVYRQGTPLFFLFPRLEFNSDSCETENINSYAKRVCDGFAAIGVRGVSLLFGSGDVGVGPDGPDAYQCVINDGTNTSSFVAMFPSSCP
jgi:hypothetical protein